MDKILKSLFDFQRFAGESALQSIITSMEERYPANEEKSPRTALTAEEMDQISAAGNAYLQMEKDKWENLVNGGN